MFFLIKIATPPPRLDCLSFLMMLYPGMLMRDLFVKNVSFIDAAEMFFSFSSWINSSLFPLIPLMFVWRKVLIVIMRKM